MEPQQQQQQQQQQHCEFITIHEIPSLFADALQPYVRSPGSLDPAMLHTAAFPKTLPMNCQLLGTVTALSHVSSSAVIQDPFSAAGTEQPRLQLPLDLSLMERIFIRKRETYLFLGELSAELTVSVQQQLQQLLLLQVQQPTLSSAVLALSANEMRYSLQPRLIRPVPTAELDKVHETIVARRAFLRQSERQRLSLPRSPP